MKIKIKELEQLVEKVLLTEYSTVESSLIKDVVLFGELSGKPSHGLLRLLRENYGVFVSGTRGTPEYLHKTTVSSVIDGKNNPGMLIGQLAANEVIRLAKTHGVGIVGTKGSINSTGSLTYYAQKIAQEDLIAMVFTQCSPIIAPFNMKKALFGTNPIAFGIPSASQPLIFDMSTSAITFGAMAKAKADGKRIPTNTALDKDGTMTTDPSEALEGATLPFDNSYKGSGISMMVEILGSLWPGASFAGMYAEEGWGNVYMAFSPTLLSDTNLFKEKVTKLLKTLEKGETRDGEPVRIPGERSRNQLEETIRKGEVEVEENVLNELKKYLEQSKTVI